MFQKRQIFKLSILKKLLSDENGCVSLVPSTRLLALPPFFLNDMKSGILYLLNCMLKKYDRSLGGIVIGYQNIKVLMDENTGIIPMGTPEIEVNISVEFYIFQPKIGSLLEGSINKKSNSHIGCLVHQYFNATILKPEDVDFDDWICKDFNVDDKIIFKVKDLDFTSLLPYIEGVVDENFIHKGSFKRTQTSDVNDVNKSVQNSSFKEELFPAIMNEDSAGELSEKIKCPPSKGEDSILYSTQLEPKSDSKMMISFCSPIPRGTSSGMVDGEWTSDLSILQDSQTEIVGMEKKKKKKHKRRQKEDEDEWKNVKKIKKKISSTSFTEIEDSNIKMPETTKLIEELFREQVSRTMGDSVKESERINFKGKKSSKRIPKRQRKKETLCKNSDAEMPEKQLISSEFNKQDLSRKEELRDSGKDSVENKSKEDTLKKLSSLKKSSKVQPNKVNSVEEEKKTAKKLNIEDNIKGGRKKPKTVEMKRKVSREGTDDSLCRKTLKETKNAVDLGTYEPPPFLPTKKLEKITSKKDSELSDLSTSSSKKRHSQKKSKHKEKLNDRPQARDRYKNGSMYDMKYSPEKLHPDKSLFTDSEQSHASPAKKRKEVNGVEVVSEGKSRVQNKLNIFCNDELTGGKSEPEREVSKDSDKNEKNAKKSKREFQSPDQQKQSLFEKLLEQARRLVDIKGNSSTERKGKSESRSKKQTTA